MIRGAAYATVLCGTSLLVLLLPSVSSLSCLVIRPGRGLVSEKCPNNSVACRMRIENNAIVWYEYSKLYDRNHMACILKEEYARLSVGEASKHQDWCARNSRGTMRCWCAGSDCNEAPRIRRVYRAFLEAEERNQLSNEIPTPSYRRPLPTTPPPPPPVVATTPSHTFRPYYYTRIFAPTPTTTSYFLRTNNYQSPKKNWAHWETTTMRARLSTADVRLTAYNVHPDTNSELIESIAFDSTRDRYR